MNIRGKCGKRINFKFTELLPMFSRVRTSYFVIFCVCVVLYGGGGECEGECGDFMMNAGSHGTEQLEESGLLGNKGIYHSYTAVWIYLMLRHAEWCLFNSRNWRICVIEFSD